MKFMDQLPSVTTCCFCSYLRGGCVLIAVMSFLAGLLLAPNVANIPWNFGPMDSVTAEQGMQITLGIMSILLCTCSVLLFVGAICNIPMLVEIYQWGAMIYGVITSCVYIIMTFFCFLMYSKSVEVGCWMILLVFLNIILTSYFMIVANSLRMSILFLQSTDVLY